MTSPSHLLVHYHRLRADYTHWQLAVLFPDAPRHNLLFAPPLRHSRTSFGAVFRVDLSLLPPTASRVLLLPVRTAAPAAAAPSEFDGPPRELPLRSLRETVPSQPLHHAFLAQHSPHVRATPAEFVLPSAAPRFLFLTLPPVPTVPPSPPPPLPLLYVFVAHAATRAEEHVSDGASYRSAVVFPSTPRYRPSNAPTIFVVDLLSFATASTLHPLLVADRLDFHPAPASPPSGWTAALALPPPSYHLNLRYDSSARPATSFTPASTATPSLLDFAQLLSAQACHSAALSAHIPAPAPLPPAICTLLSKPPSAIRASAFTARNAFPTTLTIYVHTLGKGDNHAPSTLTVTPRDAPKPAITVRQSSFSYAASSVFIADLTLFPEPALANGLSISTATATHIWTPRHGPHVIIANTFPRLLTPAEASLRLYYHRLDNFLDWSRWRLRLSVDENGSHTVPATTVTLAPARPHRPGVVFFNLVNIIFPYGAVVRAELFRLSAESSTSAVDDPMVIVASSDVSSDAKPSTDADVFLSTDRRDVVREWRSGRTPTELHLVQGDVAIHSTSPTRHSILAGRRFRIRYRRFLPRDYDNWDLWTWDDADASQHRVAVAADVETSSPAWCDFIIDRAQYGAAANVAFVPRRGGDEWLEKDDPVRVCCFRQLADFDPNAARDPILKSCNDMPSFIITQATSLVLRSLKEVCSMMTAYVDSETSIMLSPPVPIAWVSPPKKGRSNAVADTVLKVCNEEMVQRVTVCKDCDINVHGKAIRVQKVEQMSPTAVRLHVKKHETLFDEDYLVEKVVVLVPGFHATVLSWQRHEDWDAYLYDGTLGWEYDKEWCAFRCFAPTADGVSVVLYDSATGKAGRTVVAMRRIPQGCWKAIVKCDVKGKYYKLLADGENKRLFPGVEVIDPYSRCNTSHFGRGFIFGTETSKIAPRPNIKPSEAIVYELHIRDMSIDASSGISRRGLFCGLAERGTRAVGISLPNEKKLSTWEPDELYGVEAGSERLDILSTGLDHIVQMGVNTVQILPIQDFDNDESNDLIYNWGYMPVHFNSPDGWYASSTMSEARVTEFKLLVDALHKAGLKVIMDVVYNHTAEDSNEFNLDARFSFNGLAPRYYYRTCGNTPVAYTGHSTCAKRQPDEPRCGECYSNGSGCGNEFRSDARMGRKFIIDSLKYWVNEYQVDGFRFDLMGLIDVETMTQAAAELHKIDNNIMVYGEPWAGGLSPMRTTEKGMQRSKGFAVFNDTYRDAIRGSPFKSEETFVMDGGRLTEIKGGIIGSIDSFCDSPLETINYVECHDNYTLWDHFRFYLRSRMDDISFSEDDLRRMHRLAAVLVLTSQGVPFIQAGQEMCRTKFDVENSYNSPDDINMIRWHNKVKEWTTVQYYRGLMLLRRSHPEIFCKESGADVHDSLIFYEDLGLPVPDRCVAYRIKGDEEKLLQRLNIDRPNLSADERKEESLKWTEVVVIFNPTPSLTVFRLPDADDDCIWFQVVDATSAGVRNIRGPIIGSVEVQGRSAAILRHASQKDTVDAQLMLRLDAISESYSSFEGDDVLSRYAVGLDKRPTAEDVTEHQRLRELRIQFEANRTFTASKNPPPPSNLEKR